MIGRLTCYLALIVFFAGQTSSQNVADLGPGLTTEIKSDSSIVFVDIHSLARKEIADCLLKVNMLKPKVVGLNVIFQNLGDLATDSLLARAISQIDDIVLLAYIDSVSEKVVSSHRIFTVVADHEGFASFLVQPEDYVKEYIPLHQSNRQIVSFGGVLSFLYRPDLMEDRFRTISINSPEPIEWLKASSEFPVFDCSTLDEASIKGRIVIFGNLSPSENRYVVSIRGKEYRTNSTFIVGSIAAAKVSQRNFVRPSSKAKSQQPPFPSGRWWNADVCENSDVFVFDFSEKVVADVNGNAYPLALSETMLSFEIRGRKMEWPITRIDQNDSTMKIWSDDVFLDLRKVVKTAGLSGRDLEGKLFWSADGRNVKDKYYLEFFDGGSYVVTHMSSTDTTSHLEMWRIFGTKLGTLLELTPGVRCRSFFPIEKNRNGIKFMRKNIAAATFVELANDQEISKKPLLGNWKVVAADETTPARVTAVKFTSSSLTMFGLADHSDNLSSRSVQTTWCLDYFGKTIVSGLKFPHTGIAYRMLADGRITLHIENVTYTLEKDIR
jgi:hypothetical protein